ncbi:MAG: DUF3795 domain-containing protein [candidate division Zixibacteria bacterium]|nr:DUF3795 domain-containing protein [candidate division Zixibacteria bacterium]
MPGILIGYCGLYCGQCPIYLASTTFNDNKKEKLAKKYARELDKEISPKDIHCWGCRAGNRNCWGKSCKIRKCASDMGVEFCYQCHKYPCPDIDDFCNKHPDALQNLNKISKIGVEAFISEMSLKKK